MPPGRSTLIIPVKQLYVGEKSRPGRTLRLDKITRLVFGIGDKPAALVLLDNLRLERDESAARVGFAGLHAFDFGTSASPVMDGFTPITPATQYSRGRGYGLKDARDLASIRRAPARSALPGLHLHRSGRPGGRRAQRQVPGLRQYRQPIGLSGANTRPTASARSSPKAGRL